MVRLKVVDVQNFMKLYNQFQFQYGSIKRFISQHLIYLLTMFQFQYGSIKSQSSNLVLNQCKCFNSNMVRLKEETVYRCR